MLRRRAACPILGLLASCRVNAVAPHGDEPVVLVTPDTPSARQTQLASLAPAVASGDPAKLDGAIDDFEARTKSRRGYIAIDKPLYQPGETIWFRAFDVASATFAGTERDAATIKLIAPRGSTIVEKRVIVELGAAGGDIPLMADLPGGEYTLVAQADGGMKTERKLIVSSYQPPRIKKKLEFMRKAYGPGDTVAATLSLHRATGEALANKQVSGAITLDGVDLPRVPIATDGDGNAVVSFALPPQIARGDGLLTILVDDGGVTESVQKRIPIALRDLAMQLYPEGGDLIAGLPARVYFAAKNALDKPADIDGRVVDDRGKLVALLASYHDGMGRFELIPDAGRKYRVEITRPVGIARTFELPAARAAGCAMQALDDFASQRADLRVAVWCTKSQAIAVTAVLRDKRTATATAAVTAGEPAIVSLAMPAGVQGAVRVTVFDGDLDPQAERLVYRNRGADFKVAMHADHSTYHPRDKVALAIETTAPDGKPIAADLALSVVDDTVLAFADDKQATLFAKLYLEAEMPGQKIEEPNFYFGSDAKAPASLDLVLGTAGWRRFDWKAVLSPPQPPIEDAWTFTGDPWAKRPRTKIRKAVAKAGDKDKDKEELANEKNVAPKEHEAHQKPALPPANDEAKKGKKAAADDEDALVDKMAPAAPMEELDVMPARGEMLEIQAMGGRLARFDNRGFDVGTEADRHRHHIRGAKNGEEVAQDPYCCVVPERQFPAPTYTGRYDGPRTDFRETLMWQSRVATGATGKATVELYLSDAVTSFKATAEGIAMGGILGRGEALIQSKKPVSLAVKMPLEVSEGDHVRLPVTIANETAEPYTATLRASFGKAFRVTGGALAPSIQLAPNERRSTFYELDVVGDGKQASDGKIALAVAAANLEDSVEQKIRVGPVGFPQEISMSGTLAGTITREVTITDVLPGTMTGKLTMYPSPLATMVEGTEAMIAEPGGCFEQASSTNYPNIMILGYLEEHKAAKPEIVERANKALDHGYKLLTGYETRTRGYEWFGGDPGHEALTAYGLMEFREMAKVYGDVDRAMVDRTRGWLLARRDGNGGFKRNERALDSFGSASREVTDAYITYALAEAGEHDLAPELDRQREQAASTKDPYVLALAAKALLDVRPKEDATRVAIKRLVELQAKDGSFPGADHSITRSGGDALLIESTSLAAMAMMASGDHMPEVRRAVEWIDAHRGGAGNFGSTQSTVLALKAMAMYARASALTEAAGVVTLRINGKEVGRVSYEKGHQGAIELPLGEHLRPGKNVIEIALDSPSSLPYSALVTWGSKVPATSPHAKVHVATALARSSAHLGEGVRMNVTVTNGTAAGLPMAIARIGLPGGLTFQTWQLQELRDKKLIDYYETRPREVILYFRSLAPHASKDVPLELIASVPGAFTAPASRAYLYYTDEHKHWVEPTTITISP
jgi:hypothetical protein